MAKIEMGAALSVRLPIKEKALIRKAAKKLGEDLSEFSRAAIVARATAVLSATTLTCYINGEKVV